MIFVIGHLIKLRFNPAGQPIGPTAATFSTNIGRIVKTHVPPTYNSWKKVPQHLKEDVWKHVLVSVCPFLIGDLQCIDVM